MLTELETRRTVSFSEDIPFVSCSTVCCGTSRVIVFSGDELPAEKDELEYFLSKALVGEKSAAEGLKGEHYQFNKVAIIDEGSLPSHIKFRFLQFDSRNQCLIPNLECGNLSVGAGMVALVRGISSLNEKGSLFATNMGTGQQVELIPQDINRIWAGDWTVRFLKNINCKEIYAQAHFESIPINESESIDCWITEQGNVFIFVNVHPELASPDLVELIETTGKERALNLGLNAAKSSMPKIIFYSTDETKFENPAVDACCFFNSEIHNSLPGSGSMSLASFLTASLLLENGVPNPNGTVVFNVRHPSGFLDVSVDWATVDNEIIITNTSFATSAKLLLHGQLAI